ncbi:MAG: hypothetical protein HY851_02190 [candidate division Zixibacteria bacterium]|nr:hypothetical protein [candidate division Zixibacteria bacterium]
MKTLVVLFSVLVLALSVSAQKADIATLRNASANNPIGLKASNSLFSLIDLSKIRWSNSYSVSYFSGASISGSMGMLHTSMFYPISSKLNLMLDLGVAHGISGDLNRDNRNVTLLPSFQLDYRPNKNMSMSICFQSYNGLISPYGYRGAGYLINPFGPE